jgi:hypothetical protein
VTRDLHTDFLATVLPKVETHARIAFRFVPCEDRRADLIQEVVALSWLWYKRLRDQGKNPAEFPSAIAGYAVRAVVSGRQLCGQESSKDVLSRFARRRRQFSVSPLPDRVTFAGSTWEDALQDNAQTPVPEAVAFKIDFMSWLSTLSVRNREVAEDMAVGHRTDELADLHAVSPARISQLHRQFHESWTQFMQVAPAAAV